MSQHHQDASAHFQFKQSPHRQRVCTGFSPCSDHGQFVYAAKSLWGFRSGAYDPDHLPAVLPKLYRRVEVEHKKDMYYGDGEGGWIYFTTVYSNITIQLSHDCDGV